VAGPAHGVANCGRCGYPLGSCGETTCPECGQEHHWVLTEVGSNVHPGIRAARVVLVVMAALSLTSLVEQFVWLWGSAGVLREMKLSLNQWSGRWAQLGEFLIEPEVGVPFGLTAALLVFYSVLLGWLVWRGGRGWPRKRRRLLLWSPVLFILLELGLLVADWLA